MAVLDRGPDVSVVPPGPRSRDLGARAAALECPAFGERRAKRAASQDPAPSIVLARGHGSNVWDVDENRFVDLAAGFGAAILGHGPSPAHQAAHAQIDVLVQGLGDLYPSDVKVALLERLARLVPSMGAGARVMLGQSGADAVTIALKTAVLATSRAGVLAFEGAYHGLSYAPLAACGFRASFREPFAEQLGQHVVFAPYPSPANEAASLVAVRSALERGTIGAVLLEPILGRGGVVVPNDSAIFSIARLAREAGALLVADEIWTGMGRSGAMLRSVEVGLAPDLVAIGKGLGASFPISACIGTEASMAAWARSGEVLHTSTHAGAPIGAAAALATLAAVEELGLAPRARRLGAELRARLSDLGEPIVSVRGEGLIVGVEWASGVMGLRAASSLLRMGYLVTVGGAQGEVTVLTPPLTIDEGVLFGVVDAFARTAAVLGAARIAGDAR